MRREKRRLQLRPVHLQPAERHWDKGIIETVELLQYCFHVVTLPRLRFRAERAEPSDRLVDVTLLCFVEASAASAPHPSCDGTPAPALDRHTSLENQMLLFLFVLFSKCISAGWVSGASHAVHTLQY